MTTPKYTGFKYSSRDFNDGLLTRGNIRVGTLLDYRKQEHKAGISDPTEGTKRLTLDLPGVNKLKAGEVDNPVQKIAELGSMKIVGPTTFENVQFVVHQESRDSYVYCLSAECSRQVMQQFEGADDCVEILDLCEFSKHVTSALQSKGAFKNATVVCAPVWYRSRDLVFQGTAGHPPSLIKEETFSQQKEMRIIWEPTDSIEIAPITIDVPELCKLVRRVTHNMV